MSSASFLHGQLKRFVKIQDGLPVYELVDASEYHFFPKPSYAIGYVDVPFDLALTANVHRPNDYADRHPRRRAGSDGGAAGVSTG